MTAVPAATPVTTPDEGLTVATAGAPLLHVPPPDKSVNAEVDPAQILVFPIGVDGMSFTVTVVIAAHPSESE